MVVDAVRTYLDAANGLTELSRKQAVAAAKTLLRANGSGAAVPPSSDGEGPPPRVGQSIQTLAGELIETSQANRAAVADLVRDEVKQALEQLDVVPRAEYDRMARRVAELERRMAARHAVERVLAPRGGAASSLPGVAEELTDERTDEAAARVGEPDDEAVSGDGAADETAASAGPGDTVGDSEAASTAEDGDATGESGDHEGQEHEGQETEPSEEDAAKAQTAKQPATAKASASRGQAKTGAKAGAKTATKNTRSRSAAKRTTKGKGTKK
ncbi:membrane fusogenic activity family protein [Nocardiopsis nanhaiensis]